MTLGFRFGFFGYVHDAIQPILNFLWVVRVWRWGCIGDVFDIPYGWFEGPISCGGKCGDYHSIFNEVICFEVVFPGFFCCLRGRKPPWFCVFGVKERGGGVAHVWIA